MRTKFFLLLIASLVIAGGVSTAMLSPQVIAFASPALSKTSFNSATVNSARLNVRTGPSTNSQIVCTLKSGETVEVYGKIGDWYLIFHPSRRCVGMVFGQYLKPAGSVQLPTKSPVPVITKAPLPTPTKPPVPTKTPSPTKTTATVTPKPISTPSGGTVSATAEEKELLGYVNEERKKTGVGLLSFDTNVIKTARLKARDMVEKNYFSHQSPTYGSPFDMMRQFGITFKSAGENIAGNSSVKGAFDAWMKSEGHRKNILNGNFNYCGFGIEPSPTYGKVLVQQFIGR